MGYPQISRCEFALFQLALLLDDHGLGSLSLQELLLLLTLADVLLFKAQTKAMIVESVAIS